MALLNLLDNPVWQQAELEFLMEKDASPILLIANNKKDYNHLIANNYKVDILSETKANNEDFTLEVEQKYDIVIWTYPSKKYLNDDDLFDNVLYEISEISNSWASVFISTTKPINRPWNMLTGTESSVTYLI